MAWFLCITGIVLCLAGVYHFRLTAFEEDKSIRPSILIMIMGVILISIGTAKYFGLIK